MVKISLDACCKEEFEGCCCNCKHQLILHKHPQNKEFGKGSIEETCGYVCTEPELCDSKIGFYFDKKHGMCEFHTPKNK